MCEFISRQHSATSVEREDPVCTSLLWVIPYSPAAQSHAGQVNWIRAEPADVCVCEFVIMCLCVCVCHQLKKEDQTTDHVTGLSQRVFHPAESFGFIRFVFITQLPCFRWLTVLIMQPPIQKTPNATHLVWDIRQWHQLAGKHSREFSS